VKIPSTNATIIALTITTSRAVAYLSVINVTAPMPRILTRLKTQQISASTLSIFAAIGHMIGELGRSSGGVLLSFLVLRNVFDVILL